MTPRSLQFASFTLDLDRLCLRTPSGEVKLRPKSFEVLRFLVENSRRVVTKEEVINAVWPHVTVTEESLTRCISEVRRALGNESQHIVKTVPKRGYLLDVEIKSGAAAAVPTAMERPAPLEGNPTNPPRPSDEAAVAVAVRSRDPERRQLTILVCNVVGLSALSARLDPEDLREVMAAYYECVREVVEHYGGLVATHSAEGATACFGYPQAHEDDAERAVRAGLAATRAVGDLRIEVLPERLQARVGIATGLVVVGDVSGNQRPPERALVGETPLLAVRLLRLAAPSAVVMSGSTRRLVGRLFEYRDFSAAELKDIDGPVDASLVLREGTIASRFEALHGAGASPLLGREEELDLLMRRWGQAKSGSGRVVLLTGEAGIGKSRITQALQDRLTAQPHTALIYHCSPYHQDTALHPFIARLLRAAGIQQSDDVETKLSKLESLLATLGAPPAEHVVLFAALLSIPGGERYPLSTLTPQQLKERSFSALVDQLRLLCTAQPVLLVFEDLHWIDPTSLELLSHLVEQASDLPLLLVATARPEFAPPWPNHWHISTLALTRLGRGDVEILIETVAQGRVLPAEVIAQIVARTDGVPLFIEELTKTVVESGILREVGDRYELTGPVPPRFIPSTLHASLLARLDRLASVKDIAQIGAAIGGEFSYGLIAAVSALPERDLKEGLAQLVAAQLIFQRGAPPDATYRFKHALVQEATYASLVRSRRQQLHARIARILEERHPDIVSAEPEVVAYHFTEAGLIEPAIDYWRKAGQHSLACSAYNEAVKQLTRAIEMLRSIPETAEVLEQELETRMKMVPALIAAKGAGSSEVELLYLRAQELVDRLGKTSLRFRVLWGLWFVKYCRGQYGAAREAGESLLDLGRTVRDSSQVLEAHHAMWALLSAMGNLDEAVRYMEQGIALYDREPHGSQTPLYAGHDPGACCRYHLAKDLWRNYSPRVR
jgi:class 3 adenylate cyclase/tetratricopeptide (TPR) repeat protein